MWPDEARAIVKTLGDSVSFYKVGLELFSAAGPDVVRGLIAADRRVFLDLKYHDIPNTVAGAVSSASGVGADLLTVHTSGGPVMMAAAAAALGAHVDQPVGALDHVQVVLDDNNGVSQFDQTLDESIDRQYVRRSFRLEHPN